MSSTPTEQSNNKDHPDSSPTNQLDLKVELGLYVDAVRAQNIRIEQLELENHELKQKATIWEGKCEELHNRMVLENHRMKLQKKEIITKEDSLEGDMLKANVDTSRLKMIVLPMEEEAAFLKSQVSELQARLAVCTEMPVTILPEVPIETLSVSGGELDEPHDEQEADTRKQKEPDSVHELKSKVRARDIHVMALLKNIKQLKEELAQVKDENTKLNNQLETVSSAHADLQQTWEKANETFVKESTKFQNEIASLRRSSCSLADCPTPVGPLSINQSDNRSDILPDSVQQKLLSTQAELAHTKQQLELERNQTKDYEKAYKIYFQDIEARLSNCETEITSMYHEAFEENARGAVNT